VECAFRTSGNTIPVSFNTATTAGELIVTETEVGTSGGPDGGVTDNASGGSSTYTSIETNNSTYGSFFYLNFYYAYNVAAGITTLTLNLGSVGDEVGNICAAHYKGVATSSPLDISKAFLGSQTTPWTSTATGTLSQANELIVGDAQAYCNDQNCFTSTSALTIEAQSGDADGFEDSYADDIVSSTSSVTYTGTITGGLDVGNTEVAIATFKAAPNTTPRIWINNARINNAKFGF
jgi:hypothetical protein